MAGGGRRREVWLGFGPEDLDVPLGFVLPVSSFGEYGGHASLHVWCDPAPPRGWDDDDDLRPVPRRVQ